MKRAFSLTELLISIAIILIVCALTFPIVSAVKASARKSDCLSNMHQMWVATELYRQDQGSTSDSGNLFQMGLPSYAAFAKISIYHELRCQGELSTSKETLRGYLYLATEPQILTPPPTWSDYVASNGNSSVIFADWEHNDLTTVRLVKFPKLGLGVQLDGTVVQKRKVGTAFQLSWWAKK